VKPDDALAHLADALMEDIFATPPQRLAIEEIVDASGSRELVFRFDDVLAEASAVGGERPAARRRGAISNLTDALCEDIAVEPDEGLYEVTDDCVADPALACEFDAIVRRDPLLAGLAPQSGPSYLAL
jgi:hypothetical protein